MIKNEPTERPILICLEKMSVSGWPGTSKVLFTSIHLMIMRVPEARWKPAPNRASTVFYKRDLELPKHTIASLRNVDLTRAGALSLVNMLKVCAERMTKNPKTVICIMGAAVAPLM